MSTFDQCARTFEIYRMLALTCGGVSGLWAPLPPFGGATRPVMVGYAKVEWLGSTDGTCSLKRAQVAEFRLQPAMWRPRCPEAFSARYGAKHKPSDFSRQRTQPRLHSSWVARSRVPGNRDLYSPGRALATHRLTRFSRPMVSKQAAMSPRSSSVRPQPRNVLGIEQRRERERISAWHK